MPFRFAQLRGQKVLARCDDSGALVVDGGRVEIRYKPTDTKAYRAAERNLELMPGDVIADDAVAVAVDTNNAGGKRGGSGGSGKRGGSGGRSNAAAPRSGTTIAAITDGALIAYTDGACTGNPGPAGLGVVLIDGDKRKELSRYLGRGTNNIAELTAIEEALNAASDPGRTFVIHTDSQYAIGVLSKGWKAKANQELVARIKAALSRFSRVELRYVRGHAGVPDNERADELARAAVVAQASSGWVQLK